MTRNELALERYHETMKALLDLLPSGAIESHPMIMMRLREHDEFLTIMADQSPSLDQKIAGWRGVAGPQR